MERTEKSFTPQNCIFRNGKQFFPLSMQNFFAFISPNGSVRNSVLCIPGKKLRGHELASLAPFKVL